MGCSQRVETIVKVNIYISYWSVAFVRAYVRIYVCKVYQLNCIIIINYYQSNGEVVIDCDPSVTDSTLTEQLSVFGV